MPIESLSYSTQGDPLLQDFEQDPARWAKEIASEVTDRLGSLSAPPSATAMANGARQAFRQYLEATHRQHFHEAARELEELSNRLDSLVQLLQGSPHPN